MRKFLLLCGLLLGCAQERSIEGGDETGPAPSELEPDYANAPVREYKKPYTVHVSAANMAKYGQDVIDAIEVWNAALPRPIFTISTFEVNSPPLYLMPCGDVVVHIQPGFFDGTEHEGAIGLANIGSCEQFVQVAPEDNYVTSEILAHELGHTLYLPDERPPAYSLGEGSIMRFAGYGVGERLRPRVMDRHVDWVMDHAFKGFYTTTVQE